MPIHADCTGHVEFVDHGAGKEMRLGNERFIRSPSGERIEQ